MAFVYYLAKVGMILLFAFGLFIILEG